MNYLAHLLLAQPNPDSCFGNLLGDFRKGVQVRDFDLAVRRGLHNHQVVDKFTDTHQEVVEAKSYFHKTRRRFAPVALDMYFDHLLIKHWHRFSGMSFDRFCHDSYARLQQRMHLMPPLMQQRVGHMISHHWFAEYAKEQGIADAITNVAKRIRFKNTFHYIIDDIAKHHSQLEIHFLRFFPELQGYVNKHGPENTALV